ncbi:MAG: hypothetical protein ACXVLQ_18875 [Bacteriovorax sp.]
MKSSLILISLFGLMTGCKALTAIDSANSIPGKLDQTYSQIQKTGEGIDYTNEKIRLNALKLAKDDILDSKNTENLEPVALGMIPGAKLFGKVATTEELMEYTFLLLQEIKDVKPDESLINADGKFPANVVAEYDHKKLVDLNQIYTIAGFCPQEKVDQIINEQIYGGGLYQKAAYVFLMARVQFLGTYLQETFLAEPMDTVKIMRETIVRLGSIDSILKAPYKANVRMDINGFIGRDPIVAALYDEAGKMDDSWNAPKLWKKVLKRFDQDLKDGNIVAGSSVNSSAVQNEIAELKATVQNYLDSWK